MYLNCIRPDYRKSDHFHGIQKKRENVQQETYEKPGPNFCLDNENKPNKHFLRWLCIVFFA